MSTGGAVGGWVNGFGWAAVGLWGADCYGVPAWALWGALLRRTAAARVRRAGDVMPHETVRLCCI